MQQRMTDYYRGRGPVQKRGLHRCCWLPDPGAKMPEKRKAAPQIICEATLTQHLSMHLSMPLEKLEESLLEDADRKNRTSHS